jgi:hypothetical protein
MTGDELLNAIDEAIKPRILERTEPTEEQTVLVEFVRDNIFHAAFVGQTIRRGDKGPMTRDEVNEAVFARFGFPIEDFPPPPSPVTRETYYER